MEADLAIILSVWPLHVGLDCIRCNWDSALGGLYWIPGLSSVLGIGLGVYEYNYPPGSSDVPPVVSGETEAAPDTGLGLNDLFNETGGGVGDTTNPTYSDTSIDDRIAADEREQQRLNDHYRQTHPGATTAGPQQPSATKQGGAFFHRAIVDHITEE